MEHACLQVKVIRTKSLSSKLGVYNTVNGVTGFTLSVLLGSWFYSCVNKQTIFSPYFVYFRANKRYNLSKLLSVIILINTTEKDEIRIVMGDLNRIL